METDVYDRTTNCKECSASPLLDPAAKCERCKDHDYDPRSLCVNLKGCLETNTCVPEPAFLSPYYCPVGWKPVVDYNKCQAHAKQLPACGLELRERRATEFAPTDNYMTVMENATCSVMCSQDAPTCGSLWQQTADGVLPNPQDTIDRVRKLAPFSPENFALVAGSIDGVGLGGAAVIPFSVGELREEPPTACFFVHFGGGDKGGQESVAVVYNDLRRYELNLKIEPQPSNLALEMEKLAPVRIGYGLQTHDKKTELNLTSPEWQKVEATATFSAAPEEPKVFGIKKYRVKVSTNVSELSTNVSEQRGSGAALVGAKTKRMDGIMQDHVQGLPYPSAPFPSADDPFAQKEKVLTYASSLQREDFGPPSPDEKSSATENAAEDISEYPAINDPHEQMTFFRKTKDFFRHVHSLTFGNVVAVPVGGGDEQHLQPQGDQVQEVSLLQQETTGGPADELHLVPAPPLSAVGARQEQALFSRVELKDAKLRMLCERADVDAGEPVSATLAEVGRKPIVTTPAKDVLSPFARRTSTSTPLSCPYPQLARRKSKKNGRGRCVPTCGDGERWNGEECEACEQGTYMAKQDWLALLDGQGGQQDRGRPTNWAGSKHHRCRVCPPDRPVSKKGARSLEDCVAAEVETVLEMLLDVERGFPAAGAQGQEDDRRGGGAKSLRRQVRRALRKVLKKAGVWGGGRRKKNASFRTTLIELSSDAEDAADPDSPPSSSLAVERAISYAETMSVTNAKPKQEMLEEEKMLEKELLVTSFYVPTIFGASCKNKRSMQEAPNIMNAKS
eukprot:g6701.t1